MLSWRLPVSATWLSYRRLRDVSRLLQVSARTAKASGHSQALGSSMLRTAAHVLSQPVIALQVATAAVAGSALAVLTGSDPGHSMLAIATPFSSCAGGRTKTRRARQARLSSHPQQSCYASWCQRKILVLTLPGCASCCFSTQGCSSRLASVWNGNYTNEVLKPEECLCDQLRSRGH